MVSALTFSEAAGETTSELGRAVGRPRGGQSLGQLVFLLPYLSSR